MPPPVAEFTVITLLSAMTFTELLTPPKMVLYTPVNITTPATTSAISRSVARRVAKPPLRCGFISLGDVAMWPLKEKMLPL
jgi:hypothetical protein